MYGHRTKFGSLLAALLFALSGGLLIGGCNTVEGAGEDVEAAGEAVEDAADDND